MVDRCSAAWKRKLAIVIWMVTAAHVPFSFAEEAASDEAPAEQVPGFRYSEDWNIVSAPPPPGPYETVNVDPRVPGQDVARPVPQDLMPTESAGQIPVDPGRMPPPGAGRTAGSGTPPSTTRARQQVYAPRPPAGAYGRQGYGRQPATGYSFPGGYPGRQTYPGYGQAYRQDYGQGYNRGYGYSYPGQYAPSRQQEIPPPPYTHMPGR